MSQTTRMTLRGIQAGLLAGDDVARLALADIAEEMGLADVAELVRGSGARVKLKGTEGEGRIQVAIKSAKAGWRKIHLAAR